MTDRDRESIGDVVGTFIELHDEETLHHSSNLVLAGASGAREGLLDRERSVGVQRHAAAGDLDGDATSIWSSTTSSPAPSPRATSAS